MNSDRFPSPGRDIRPGGRLARGLLAASWSLGLLTCGDPVARWDTLQLHRAELRLEGPIGALSPIPDDDRDDLFLAGQILATGDTVLVLDAGNHRVVLFDRELRPIGVIGQEGDGPGEFRRPRAAQVTPTSIHVMDRNRLSRFDRMGGLASTQMLPAPSPSFAVRSDGTVILSSASPDFALGEIVDDRLRPFGPRAAEAASLETLYPAARDLGAWDLLALGPDDDIFVLDNLTGALAWYSREGSLIMARALPTAVTGPIFDRMREIDAGFGRPPVFSAMFTGFSRAPGGKLLLTYNTASDVVGALADLQANEVQIIRAPVQEGSVRGWRATMGSDSLYYVSLGETVRVYRLPDTHE